MARTGSTAETSTINCVTKSVSTLDVSGYCRDLESWPRPWMGWEKDLPAGEGLVDWFRLFIQHVASSGLSGKTIRRHVDNLWLLGGEIIRDLNQTHSLRKVDVEQLLKDRIYEDRRPR
jgi:hypothetical protein